MLVRRPSFYSPSRKDGVSRCFVATRDVLLHLCLMVVSGLFALEVALDVRLGEVLNDTIHSATVHLGLCSAILLLPALPGLPFARTLKKVHAKSRWWFWLVAPFQAAQVIVFLFVAPRIGLALCYVTVACGNLVTAAIIDSFRIFSPNVTRVNFFRACAIVLSIASVVLLQRFPSLTHLPTRPAGEVTGLVLVAFFAGSLQFFSPPLARLVQTVVRKQERASFITTFLATLIAAIPSAVFLGLRSSVLVNSSSGWEWLGGAIAAFRISLHPYLARTARSSASVFLGTISTLAVALAIDHRGIWDFDEIELGSMRVMGCVCCGVATTAFRWFEGSEKESDFASKRLRTEVRKKTHYSHAVGDTQLHTKAVLHNPSDMHGDRRSSFSGQNFSTTLQSTESMLGGNASADPSVTPQHPGYDFLPSTATGTPSSRASYGQHNPQDLLIPVAPNWPSEHPHAMRDHIKSSAHGTPISQNSDSYNLSADDRMGLQNQLKQDAVNAKLAAISQNDDRVFARVGSRRRNGSQTGGGADIVEEDERELEEAAQDEPPFQYHYSRQVRKQSVDSEPDSSPSAPSSQAPSASVTPLNLYAHRQLSNSSSVSGSPVVSAFKPIARPPDQVSPRSPLSLNSNSKSNSNSGAAVPGLSLSNIPPDSPPTEAITRPTRSLSNSSESNRPPRVVVTTPRSAAAPPQQLTNAGVSSPRVPVQPAYDEAHLFAIHDSYAAFEPATPLSPQPATDQPKPQSARADAAPKSKPKSQSPRTNGAVDPNTQANASEHTPQSRPHSQSQSQSRDRGASASAQAKPQQGPKESPRTRPNVAPISIPSDWPSNSNNANTGSPAINIHPALSPPRKSITEFSSFPSPPSVSGHHTAQSALLPSTDPHATSNSRYSAGVSPASGKSPGLSPNSPNSQVRDGEVVAALPASVKVDPEPAPRPNLKQVFHLNDSFGKDATLLKPLPPDLFSDPSRQHAANLLLLSQSFGVLDGRDSLNSHTTNTNTNTDLNITLSASPFPLDRIPSPLRENLSPAPVSPAEVTEDNARALLRSLGQYGDAEAAPVDGLSLGQPDVPSAVDSQVASVRESTFGANIRGEFALFDAALRSGMESISTVDIPHIAHHLRVSALNQNGGNDSHRGSASDLPRNSNSFNIAEFANIPEVEERPLVLFTQDSRPMSIEIRLMNTDFTRPIPLGIIDCLSSDTLFEVREKILSELDRLPPHWLFLRTGKPIGRLHEHTKPVSYVEEFGVVLLCAVNSEASMTPRASFALPPRRGSDANVEIIPMN